MGANIRRTDRVLTQFFDAALAPSGINGPQFGLLTTLAAAEPISVNDLAAILEVDPTTLTRNIRVLVQQQFVISRTGEDRRTRMILLTPAGQQALQIAWPLWQEAHTQIEQTLGGDQFTQLLAVLAKVRSIAR